MLLPLPLRDVLVGGEGAPPDPWEKRGWGRGGGREERREGGKKGRE